MQLVIEGRIDVNLLPLSPYEFNLRNNGWTVWIMWEVAHAAVTNALIPYWLTGCSGSSSMHLPWHRMLPDSICSSVGEFLTNSQFWCRRKTQRWLLPEPLICQDTFPHSAVDFPRSVCWSVRWCVFVPVRASVFLKWSYYFLTGQSDSHIFSTCEHTHRHTHRSKVCF